MTTTALLSGLLGIPLAAVAAETAAVMWRQSCRPSALCLMYHRIASREECAAIHGTERKYTVPDEELENQINYLEQRGFQFLTADEAARLARGELELDRPAVALTFDDGCASVYESGLPILKRHGVPATAFITTDPASYVFQQSQPRMSDEQLRSIEAAGIRCESHSVTHRPLVQLSDEEVHKELRESRLELQRILGRDVKFLSAPGNWIDGRVLRLAKEVGYEAVWISEPGSVRKGSNLFRMPRVNVDGTMMLDEFAALLTPWGVTQRHLIYLAKRSIKRVSGPRLWYSLRQTLWGTRPDGYVSLSHWPLLIMAPALVALAVWLWIWD